MPFLPGGKFGSFATAISGDGNVVVGGSQGQAFRWNTLDGMVGLGDIPGGRFNSVAWAASSDGSIIVGRGNSDLGDEALIWDALHGARSLQTVLISDYGLSSELQGWQLLQATGISDDGLTIAGTGLNSQGSLEAWVATLPSPVPEPTSLTLLGIGVAGLCGYGWRRKRST